MKQFDLLKRLIVKIKNMDGNLSKTWKVLKGNYAKTNNSKEKKISSFLD